MSSSYVPPIIEVYQEFKAAGAVASDPNLSAVVVGPCYHILTYANNKSLIKASADYANTELVVPLPSAKAGMKILNDSDVKVYLDEAVVEVVAQINDAAFTAAVDTANVVVSTGAAFVTKKVAVGDDVVFDGSSYKVLEVVSNTTLKLNKNIPGATVTGKSIKVTRVLSNVLLPAGSSNYAVDQTNKTVTIKETSALIFGGFATARDLISAQVYVEYKALDVTYVNEPADISGTDDITTKLGIISGDDNPLAMGANVLHSNAQVKVYALAIESDDLTGWGKAVSAIKKRDLYAKALLTQNTSYISLFKVLEVANEAVKVAKYGITFGNHKVEDLAVLNVVASSATGEKKATGGGTSTNTIFTDANATFLTSGVAAGDLLKIGTDVHIVDTISSENQLSITTTTAFTAIGTGVTYTIDRNLTDEALATRVANVSKSFSHKRVVMTFPDYCQVDGKKVPGYYCTCVAAGMVAGLPANAGLTYKGAAVVEKVFNSNFKFDYDQLNIIAGGGTMIFMQDDPASLPYIRHQLTTDLTTTKTSEVSVIKNNDYVSFKFKATMKKFLGIYNVQEGLFTMLTAAFTGDIESMSRSISVELGPILISASIVELKQSETNADQVEAVIDTVQPAPFNRGILKIIA